MDTVIIRSFHNSIPAQITSGKLSEHGIDNYLWGEGAVQLGAMYNSPDGAIKLVVKKSDAEKALQLLYEFDEEYRKSAACIKCGSNDIALIEKTVPQGSFMTFIQKFISVNPEVKNVYECRHCGNQTDFLPVHTESDQSRDLL